MTNAEHTGPDRTGSPRTLFARRFTELYEAAGNPTLRRVATASDTRMRAAQGNRPGGASAQRISDWKAGRNVPARFESLLPVVLTLIDLARKKATALPRELADPKEWQRLWQAATTWNPEDDTEAACPYPGLTAYGPENRALFFGRTRATAELTDLVRAADGIVAVIGASGAGKSSLLAAGLTPALTDWETIALTPGAHPLQALLHAIATDNRPEDPTRPATPSVTAGPASTHDRTERKPASTATPDLPTPAPITAVAPDLPTPQTIPASADPASTATDRILTTLAPRSGRPRRLLIIDQFEELFTACTDEHEREHLLELLARCAGRTDDPIAVVVALRADFYAHCLNYQVLQHTLEHRGYLLGPMRSDELAQAISGPARAAGLELEPGLEELVATELCGAGDHHGRRTYDPGALPLLSHVMAATWQQREGRRLTVSGYRTAGGVIGSVAETAEYAWNELTSTQQLAAKEILLGLVTVTQDARDTRRPAQRSELLRRAPNPEDATAALELLARTRLISLDADAVHLTHEIVLTAWPRLRNWIDEDRVGYLVRQRVETDAAEWAAQERDSSLLYRGSRLRDALERVDPPPVGPLAAEFLAAAADSRSRSRRRSTRVKVILAIFGVILLLLGIAAYTQMRLAEQRRDDKNYAAVLAEADRLQDLDPSLAAQLNLVAWRMRPGDEEVRSRLLRTQNTALVTATPALAGSIDKVLYRPGGSMLGTLSISAGLRLWNSNDTRQWQAVGDVIDGVGDFAFDSTGMLLATTAIGGSPNVVTLWDISTPAAPKQLATFPEIPDHSTMRVAFVPKSRTLAILTRSTLTFWDVTNRTTPAVQRTVPLRSVNPGKITFSPDGHSLALLQQIDRQYVMQLWDVSDPANPILRSTPAIRFSMETDDFAFGPDSRVLAVGNNADFMRATGSTKGVVELWDVTDTTRPQQISTLTTDNALITALGFAPDGRTVAIGNVDGIRQWNITDPRNPVRQGDLLITSPGICEQTKQSTSCSPGPTALTYSPDGRDLTVGATNGSLQLWSPATALITGHSGSVGYPAFDTAGTRMVTASGDGRIILWDIRDPLTPVRIGEYAADPGFKGISLSPDGSTLLVRNSNGLDRQLYLLDISDPRDIRQIADWRAQLPMGGGYPTISADWRWLARLGDTAVDLWDITDRLHPVRIDTPIPLPSSANPVIVNFDMNFVNGDLVIQQLVASRDHSETVAQRWDLSDPAQPRQRAELLRRPVRPTIPSIGQLAFTPDGRTMIAVGNGTDSFEGWDISDPAHPVRLGEPVVAHTAGIRSISFTADSRTMLTTGRDGAVQLWDVTDPATPRRHGGTLMAAGLPQWSAAAGSSGTPVWDATLTADGRFAAAASEDGAIRLWDLDEQHSIDRICTVTGKMWTEDLWQRYLPQLPYAPPCR